MTVEQVKWLRFVARWHRRLALFVMLWLAALAVTGLLVNHANDWALDSAPLYPPVQRLVYGTVSAGENFCDGFPAAGADCRAIFARLEIAGGAVLLATHSLILVDDAGEPVERLPVGQAGLDTLKAAFASGDALYLSDGTQTVVTGPDLLDFTAVDTDRLDGAEWIRPGASVDEITWERFLLDLHAARFLGPLAKAFNDLMAITILLLAVSGFWMHRIKRHAASER